MATKRINTDLDLLGNAVYGMATAAPGTATQQGASTAFVADAVKAGNAKWLDVIGLQSSGLLSGLLGVDTTIAGSDFVWNKDYLPAGRSLYLEVYSSGSALTTQAITTLYTAAGAAVTGSATTTTGTTAALVRSGAFTLTDGVTYQVHFKTAILGTGTLKLVRLIIL